MNEPSYSVGAWTADDRNGTVDRIFRGKTAASYSPANHSDCRARLFFVFSFSFFPTVRTNAQTVRRANITESIELFDSSHVYLNETRRYRSLFNSAGHRRFAAKKISSGSPSPPLLFFCCVNSINYSISFRNFTDLHGFVGYTSPSFAADRIYSFIFQFNSDQRHSPKLFRVPVSTVTYKIPRLHSEQL